MLVLVVDVGGNHVKVLVTGQGTPREFASGPLMTAEEMVSGVLKASADWKYDVVSIGYPGAVVRNKPVSEPHNLAPGWVGFDFDAAFGYPVKLINDAAMQALGSYEGGKMLFLGLGTGLGSTMIVDGIVEPMELGHLPYKKHTYEDYVGVRGLKRRGKKKWRKHVADVVAYLIAALQPNDVVVGGGNVNELKELPPGCRSGDNANAFLGGFRMWEEGRDRNSPTSAKARIDNQEAPPPTGNKKNTSTKAGPKTQARQFPQRPDSAPAYGQTSGDNTMSTPQSDIAFLFDVDNTLLDNDRVVADLQAHLEREVGTGRAEHYWRLFEQLQRELGYADYLGAMQRYRGEYPHDPDIIAVSRFLLNYLFAERLFPRALEVIQHVRQWGPTALFTDGDVVFQPRKVDRSGLFEAVGGIVFIYLHKEVELADVEQRCPAKHYVVVEDKLRLLAAIKKIWGRRVTTVFVRQGHYALDPKILADYPAADISVGQIGNLLDCDLTDFTSPSSIHQERR